jgi:hypothetical protein
VLIAMAAAVVAIVFGLGVWSWAAAVTTPVVGALVGLVVFGLLAWLGLKLANRVRDGGRS